MKKIWTEIFMEKFPFDGVGICIDSEDLVEFSHSEKNLIIFYDKLNPIFHCLLINGKFYGNWQEYCEGLTRREKSQQLWQETLAKL